MFVCEKLLTISEHPSMRATGVIYVTTRRHESGMKSGCIRCCLAVAIPRVGCVARWGVYWHARADATPCRVCALVQAPRAGGHAHRAAYRPGGGGSAIPAPGIACIWLDSLQLALAPERRVSVRVHLEAEGPWLGPRGHSGPFGCCGELGGCCMS